MRYSAFVERTSGEGSRAWEIHDRAREMKDAGRDIIFLSIGDPDFDTPPPIVDAVVESLRQGRTHYTAMSGIPPLREAIVARHFKLTGHRVDAGAVVVTAGAQCGLFSAMLCLAGPGDEVIVPEPMYVTYEAVVGVTAARLVQVPLRGENGFHLDPDDLAAAVTPRSRVILLNFPHNPTGATLTAEELEAVADIAKRHDLWVISDEVYGTLIYDQPHRSIVALPGMAERTVVVDSLSKSHAMTGWRLGWTISPGDLPGHLSNLALCMLYGCPPFIQDAAMTALSREFDEIAVMRAAFRERRDLLVERINAMPRIGCRKPEGSMFLMIDVRESGLGSMDFAWRLLESEGVSTLPCDGFGPSGEGYLRIALSSPLAELREFCDRLERMLRGLNC
jgi:arginine:pyruvate transaminase